MPKHKKVKQLNLFSDPKLQEAKDRFDEAYEAIHDKIKHKGGGRDSHAAYDSQVIKITDTPRGNVDRSNPDQMHAWGVGYEESTEHLDCADNANQETVQDAANFGFWRWSR